MVAKSLQWRGMAALTPVLVALAVLATSTPARADANPGVLPPQSHPYGKSYSEWANRWWQWVDGIPASVNPMVDPTGANCAQGQSGKVWFLAGSPSGSYERSCIVPHGKGLFFPVSNFQEDQREAVPDYAFFGSPACAGVYGAAFCADAVSRLGPDPTNLAGESSFLTLVTDSFIDVSAKFAAIDGQSVSNLANYRAPSGPAGYAIQLPATVDPLDNYHTIFGYSFPGPDSYSGVQDGYYLMLAPLSTGSHTLSFGEAPGWVITYHVTVQ